MLARVICVMVIAASCGASAPAPVPPRPTPAAADGAAMPPPPPPPPVALAPPPPDAGPTGCARPALEGSWLLQSGTASLTCDDGSKSSVPAGGTVRVERAAGGVFFVDGRCRYPLTENGCSLVGTAGAACADGGVRYSAREITITRDGAGGVALVYSLDQPDPEHKGGKCVASSVAKLAHAAEPKEDCALDGRWEAALPGRPSLAFKEDRCTIAAGARQSEGPCRRQGARLSVTEALPKNRGACRTGARADYVITFAQGCTGLTLEARSDACAARRDAVEYVFLEKQR
jgi:hypothetical protein